MPNESYRWQKLAPGTVIVPGNWVLTRSVPVELRGEQWFATDSETGQEALLYFPPTDVVENEVLWDEWQRRTAQLTAELPSCFQSLKEIKTEEVPWPYAVIESVAGLDLNHFRLSLANRTIPLAQLEGWLSPVVDAFGQVHEQRLCHRRLTPASFVLDREGKIRVLHFGWLALFAELEQRAAGEPMSKADLSYLSPQQLDGRPVRATDDVYGFVATLFELITSQPPFVTGDLPHQVRQVLPDTLKERLEDLGDDPDRVTETLSAAIAKGLAKSPADRFSSVKAFWESAWGDQVPAAMPREAAAPVAATTAPAEERPVARIKLQPDESADGGAAADGDPVTNSDESLGGAGPYYPPPPMTSEKRFGVVFVFIVALVIGGIAFFVDYFRDANVVERPDGGELASPGRTIPSLSTNLSSYDDFAALKELPKDVGWLSVRTDPAEVIAELWLNTAEIPIEQVTPTVFSNLPAGPVEIVFIAPGYSETNIMTEITIGQTNRISARLEIARGTVSLQSDPPGVSYVMQQGGNVVGSGQCPAEFDVRVGMYQLDYFMGNRTNTTYLRVKSDRLNEDRVVFAAGKMSVETDPEEATVYVDGVDVGQTPVTVTNLPPGGHRIIIKAARHRSVMVNAEVHRDIETFVSKTLQPLSVPEANEEWENSLGMRFLPVEHPSVLFGRFEVTRGDFRRFVDEAGSEFKVPDNWRSVEGKEPEHTVALPVVNVSWPEAVEYCRWLTARERSQGLLGEQQSYRLPSSEEWDYAVGMRSTSSALGPAYPWGAWPPVGAIGNYGPVSYLLGETEHTTSDPFEERAPVGQFSANRYGLYDIGGNVREWCASELGLNGTPQGRGGSWRDKDRARLMSDFGEIIAPTSQRDDLGFRVVLDVGQASR